VNVSQLIGLEVRTEGGRILGHLHDVRADLGESGLVVTGIVVGGAGIIERLGLRGLRRTERTGGPFVGWDAVIRADRRGVVLRDDSLE
jgi:sporulation protein YlmC with PRC-barrel domain